ncbi:plasmid mobilization protein [Adhaeribacter rhizoryzae]|uniref:Plasmid mobilization relaxosome protein MobC n=1 Tax=Adhaeribacter rhizoryzae TaxID=2607907 RepID=A0A5M6DNV7_9BACT|nr:plasmid mobilization relaxosome protein MobC [Adhaeribacter rhizoryzae]KAA5548106.1 plasmid mobilization relaxosome protein MobC [Adhaeribacter rhizoryzae]
MEAKNDNRTKWLHLRLKPQEQEQIYRHFHQTTCREISDYARKILLQKPVTINHRNQSLDEFMAELITLRKELNSIGNNFNQAVKKLHTLSQLPEFRSWLLTWEMEEKLLQEKVAEIKNRMAKIEAIWLQ